MDLFNELLKYLPFIRARIEHDMVGNKSFCLPEFLSVPQAGISGFYKVLLWICLMRC